MTIDDHGMLLDTEAPARDNKGSFSSPFDAGRQYGYTTVADHGPP